MTTEGQHGPHLLYVAWGFPPARTGGVHRALATVNRFAARGWRVTVLTVERSVWDRHTGSDPGSEALVDSSVEVIRLPFDWPAKETDLRHWSTARLLAPRVWWRWRKWADVRDFPEVAYGPWGTTLIEAARRVHASDPVDLVVATVNPYVDAVVGPALAAQGVPYVVDYRDAWSLDMFSGATVHEADSRVGRQERSLQEGAAEIWFVNDAIREWHAARWPDLAARMVTVPNGYDRDATFEHAANRGGQRFGYVGTITYHVPMAQLLDGWRLAKAQGLLGPDDTLACYGYLGYYRGGDDGLLNLLESARDVGVTYEGPVAKADLELTYAGMDVLVLAMGAGRYITSGKTYEYAATGLPIVAVHDPANAATATLAGYPALVAVPDLSAQAIADALAAGAHLGRTATRQSLHEARGWAQRLHRARVLDERIDALWP